MGNRNTVWLRSTVLRTTAPNRLERSDLQMIAVLPWCKNEDDENTDGERHEGEVALMDKEKTAGKRWKWKNMSSVPRRVYSTRQTDVRDVCRRSEEQQDRHTRRMDQNKSKESGEAP